MKCPVRISSDDCNLARGGRIRALARPPPGSAACGRSMAMTAVSAPRPGWELLAGQVNQRRYEALRAYLYEGLSLREAADAAGYTRDALASLVRDLRAGRLMVFAPPGTPGRKSARGKTPPAAGSSSCAATACRFTRSAPGSGRRAPRWAAAPSATSCARKDSAGCCAAPRPRRASARLPPGATPGCQPPASSTSLRCPHVLTPPWPGCC